MTETFHYRALGADGLARRGEVVTGRGIIRTPAFMPVGTVATVKALYPEQVREAGADILLGNTYHLMLRPGAERVAKLGGLHKFMRWDKPILTDSGGFQVMSLSKIRKITEEGAMFQSHLDGSRHMLTPERSIEIQSLLGADIQMQFDECIQLPAERREVQRAMELSLRWAERSRRAFEAQRASGAVTAGQASFGIVQGGIDPELRRRSAEALVGVGFEGYAVGGLAVGEGHELMLATLDATLPFLPQDKPRYLMGVGTPLDLIESVRRGVDMFDCVLPTRNGRHGLAYTWNGTVNLRNAYHAEDNAPLDPESSCRAARDYSRAYLHHLIRSGEYLGAMILSWVNTVFYQDLMAAMRAAIEERRFAAWAEETKARIAKPEARAA
ncbi:tRNA guanosine(34) transglycosylase Tgt [Hyphomicrobium sp. LHD-15]|uniref:tRNA guanosine(34) transglycosylase Tgt n=1 Tax=Hyphomicrobium sp. LHD-15 TaxID=3072142 RepID=UPI00280CF3F8|nr:tRNA guanosine(34) transglycosylase Tgt [Hyphomicrobium sp. LHD-15]MDQ8700579.1 tRNA guanosine(34) transglycosylase Tgt [Hyphomicrobium sp. LHD-15]